MERTPSRTRQPDPLRRTLVFGIPAAIVIGSVGKLVVNALREEEPEGPEEPVEKTRIKEMTPEEKKIAYALLQQKHSTLRGNPYHLFELEDEDAYRFLEACSLEDLRSFGILRGTEQPFQYLDSKNLWDRAVRMNPDRKPYSNRVLKTPKEKLSLESLQNGAERSITKFQGGILKETGLGNGFSSYVSPELITAIVIQEISPGELPGKIKIKPKARLELFRMMCEADWQPQKMPALYDTAISFGLGQMTLPTHKGLQMAYADETDDVIEHNFQEHTSSQQQLLNMLLLTYANLDAFSHIAKKCPAFMRAFEAANEERKARFLATVIAAYHNYGNRSTLRRRFLHALQQNFGNLEDYRVSLIQYIRPLTVAYHHARNSGALYSFVSHRAESVAAEDAREDPEVAAPTEAVEEDIIEDTLLVRVKPHAETRQRLSYYTFTAPDADLRILITYILAPGYTLDDVKKFHGIRRYAPGDIMHIPVTYLPQEMRDRRFARIPTQGKPPMELMEQYMEGGTSAKNRSFAILFGTTNEELRFPTILLKE